MLPEVEFRQRMARMDFVQLRQSYQHASWEVVGRRWAQLRPAVLTIFDNGLLRTRLAPPGLVHPPRPTEPELSILRETIEAREHLLVTDPPLTIASYFIDEGKRVERVIILTEVDE